MCDSPLESRIGTEAFELLIEKAQEALRATRYSGQPVVILEVSSSISQPASMLLAQNLKQAGFTVEQQVMDWGTVLARRAKRDGWSLFSVYSNGIDMISPLTHFYVANTCADYPSWSCGARIPPLLADYARAPTQADRKRIAEALQALAFDPTPAVTWGRFTIPAAYRADLRDLVPSSFLMFWNVDR
jgi:peptide/nickel transport system substrate-binding protein